MLSFIFVLFSLISFNDTKMLVRVYTSDYIRLSELNLEDLDIAGRKYNEYYDLVVESKDFFKIISSGLESEVISDNIELLKEQVKGQYHSYSQTNTILRNYATTYSSICILDSIGPSYEGEYILMLKISDNPTLDDSTEPGILFDGLHHAREWATVEVILFYADTLLTGYSNDAVITYLVNNNEIWLIPIVNVDGYIYDYPDQHWWRKNRKPFGGSTGTDPNRNYNGALNGDPYGAWGAVPGSGSMSNNPSSNVFCGAYSGWADCIEVMINFHRTHNINANITYHSYAEEIIWPWAYNVNTTGLGTPDSSLYTYIAHQMAHRIQKLGGGNYAASGSLYPNTGTTRTWVYGFNHFVKGINCLAYTIEVGTSFYQPTGDLDNIVRENWEGALFFAQQADTIKNRTTANVPSPDFSLPDSIPVVSYMFTWSPINSQWNNPTKWWLEDLEGYSYSTDNIESGISNWELSGYTLSTARSHSSSHSLHSGSANNISNVAQTKYPYLVQANDSFSFWCWYNLENNYDITAIEISEDLKEWLQLDIRYTGSSGSWIQKKYSLDPWIGKSVYFRFRTCNDGGTNSENFYVDDIYPVPVFSSVTIINSNITDTFYTINNISAGEHYYRVKGQNDRGWGNYSTLLKTIASTSAAIEEEIINSTYSFQAFYNLDNINISYSLPDNGNYKIQIFDISGRIVNEMDLINSKGSQTLQTELTGSVYFIRLIGNNIKITEKVITVQ